MTRDLIEAYTHNQSTKELAAHFGRSEKSIIAKLVKEKVYVPKEQPKREMTRAEIATKIADLLGLDELESLPKCSKTDLNNLLAGIIHWQQPNT